jgi:hypothetical protein
LFFSALLLYLACVLLLLWCAAMYMLCYAVQLSEEFLLQLAELGYVHKSASRATFSFVGVLLLLCCAMLCIVQRSEEPLLQLAGEDTATSQPAGPSLISRHAACAVLCRAAFRGVPLATC